MHVCLCVRASVCLLYVNVYMSGKGKLVSKSKSIN